MPRADGRIEPGQKLASAISARAWNRAQQAADIVLGADPSAAGGAVNVFPLPCVKVRLPHIGYFGEVRYPKGGSLAGGASILTATQVTSAPGNALSQFSANEKKMIPFVAVPTDRVTRYTAEQLALLVCTGNNDNEYAISGFCITRVRVLNYNHTYARVPADFGSPFPDGDLDGMLDSAFWGPAKIVGYFASDGSVVHPSSASSPISSPPYHLRWALVCL